MAHNTRVRGGADAWANILPSELATLDANLAASVNADDGGMWGPASAIIIGGAGLKLSGPLQVARGGLLTVTAAGGIAMADGDVPQYGPEHSGRTHVWMQPLAPSLPTIQAQWRTRFVDGAVQSIAPMVDLSDGNGPQVARLVVPIRAHHGSTLSSVSVGMRVGFPHTVLPSSMPGARIIRVDPFGNAQALTSQAAGADVDGYVYAPQAKAPSLWSGQQPFTVACDQNNAIDISRYQYALEIVEETWPALSVYPFSLVMLQPVTVATAGPIGGNPAPLTGLYTIDGVTLTDGMRVLVNNYPGASAGGNGIYLAHSGAWTYAADWGSSPGARFTQGCIVPVMPANGSLAGGLVNAGSYWQCSSTVTSWGATTGPSGGASLNNWVTRGKDDDETAVLAGAEFFAHGNIWQSMTCTFTGITQQAFE